jgi:isoleucyl-tRNA synthetase
MNHDNKNDLYKDTVLLPATDFPMRGNLPTLEPKILKRWEEIGLWQRQRDMSQDREKFILHDGPPYANGHLHIGHALNKILKDIINRSRQMAGYDAHYVPGWDCHGLPIEWKIEEEYRAKGLDKDEVPINEFRQECRQFAAKWIDIQREEFKRMGVLGNWDNPYTTMTNEAEATIAEELGKFLLSGALYKGAKPVLWSVVEKTALAEAEVEYQEHRSMTIFVRYPIIETQSTELQQAQIVIWTTTPWTIPGSRGIAFHADLDYGLYKITDLGEKSNADLGDLLILSPKLLNNFQEISGLTLELLRPITGDELEGMICQHPLYEHGYQIEIPVHHGDFVTDEQGSGFVHIGPGHGQDDFEFALEYGLEIPDTVAEDGRFMPHVPLFSDAIIYDQTGKDGNANKLIVETLKNAKKLMGVKGLKHSYPHSWRSKAPLIFRNTPQWFIAMEHNDLRQIALKAIDETKFYPKQGQTRLRSMIETRPDWCVSRQRAWGIPLPVFIDKRNNEVIRDADIMAKIIEIFKKEGTDAWFARPIEDFLCHKYQADDVTQVKDVCDVWFDSGSTHSFVLEKREGLQSPASLYLEGSDQHRGWFHSSLLESCGTRGRAPYQAVLTHGFILAEDGRKMSKSLGNIITPQQVIDQYGVEILRIWVSSSDYTGDLTIGLNNLKQQADMYRRLRNTLRWLLGNLHDYDRKQTYAYDALPECEQYMLHRLYEIGKIVESSNLDYDFHSAFRALHDFCANDLSSFYFDLRKDSLYCDGNAGDYGRKRSMCQYVLTQIFESLCRYLAPVISFTCEEAWLSYQGIDIEDSNNAESVHLLHYPTLPEAWHNPALDTKWQAIKQARRVIFGALEIARNEQKIRSFLEASPILYCPKDMHDMLENIDMAELAITSQLTLSQDKAPEDAFTMAGIDHLACVVTIAEGDKCPRCWRILPEVNQNKQDLCQRCHDVVHATK